MHNPTAPNGHRPREGEHVVKSKNSSGLNGECSLWQPAYNLWILGHGGQCKYGGVKHQFAFSYSFRALSNVLHFSTTHWKRTLNCEICFRHTDQGQHAMPATAIYPWYQAGNGNISHSECNFMCVIITCMKPLHYKCEPFKWLDLHLGVRCSASHIILHYEDQSLAEKVRCELRMIPPVNCFVLFVEHIHIQSTHFTWQHDLVWSESNGETQIGQYCSFDCNQMRKNPGSCWPWPFPSSP